MAKSVSAKSGGDMHNMAMVCSAIALLMIAIAAGLQDWKYVTAGTQFYSAERRWGLLYLSGVTTRTHQKVWSDTCNYVAPLMSAIPPMCISQLCKYYQQKCISYKTIMILGYSAFALLALSVLLTGIGIGYLSMKTRKGYGMSSVMFFLSFLMTTGGYFAFTGGLDTAITAINIFGQYPFPTMSTSCFVCLVGILAIFLSAMSACCAWQRKRTLENFEESAWDDEYDD